jgi:hypothetical protein
MNDSISFTLIDDGGLPSPNIGTIDILIQNNLQPIQMNQYCDEDIKCGLRLQSIDRLNQGAITYVILSLPCHGTLYATPQSSAPLTSSDLPYTISVGKNGSVWYLGDPDWNGVDNITFVALRESYKSPIGVLPIMVAPVNDAPIIVITQQISSINYLETISLVVNISDVDYVIGVPPFDVKMVSFSIISTQRALRFSLVASQLDQFIFVLGDGSSDAQVTGTVHLFLFLISSLPLSPSLLLSQL